MNIIEECKKVLENESKAIAKNIKKINKNFAAAINILYNTKGKILLSGIGKSGLTARRIASILSSTGTPSFFIHPTEGMHGDIGIITPKDSFILISNSGQSEELLNLIPYIKRHGVKIITITKNKKAPLSSLSDVTITTDIKNEACPFNLVPTTSSAVTAAMGDAIAISLLKLKGFKLGDYKNSHPGGSIGKRLLYRVEDLMIKNISVPVVNESKKLKDAIAVISRKKLGMTCITNMYGKLSGILTDGDLRRLLEKNNADPNLSISKIKIQKPVTVTKKMLAIEALSVMEKKAITSLIVINNKKENKIQGVIHMHTILKSGVV